MGKSSPDPPPAPVQIDPRATAAAQYRFGKLAAKDTKRLAESTFQETPYGTLRYENVSSGGTSGIPVTKRIQELHPAEQKLLDQQRALKGQYGSVAGQLMGKASNLFGTPVDTSSLGPMPGSAGAWDFDISSLGAMPDLGPMPVSGRATPFSTSSLGAMPVANEQTRQNVINSLMQRYQPQQAQDRSALETQLANQGFVRGSAAWDSAMDQINRRETDFRLAANLQAGGEMRADLAQQMGIRGQSLQELLSTEAERRANYAQQLGARGQGFAEQMGMRGQNLQEMLAAGNVERANIAQQLGIRGQTLQELLAPRNQTLQELSTFMTGSQPTMPQFAPVSSAQVAAPDYAGLVASNAQMQNQANINAYNAQMQNQGSGLGSLLGTAAGAFMGGPGGAALGSSIGGMFGSGGGGTSTYSGAIPGGAMSGGGWSFA